MKNRLPVWFKQELPSKEAGEFSLILRDRFKLNTVCHSAKCPNISSCFSKKQATFLILGSRCTRNCRFCEIEQYSIFDGDRGGILPHRDEPYRIAQAVKFLNLEYAVITSVTRDDLSDGGAGHFLETIRQIRKFNPQAGIEILIPDFMGSEQALKKVVQEKPDVISHNLETVKRIFPLIRHRADYRRSLNVLKNIKLINPEQITKSSIMLGLGEVDGDLGEALLDLRSVDCDMLVLGQYLCPSAGRYPVHKFYSPHEFKFWQKSAYDLGFRSVCSSPLARSSYMAQGQKQCMM